LPDHEFLFAGIRDTFLEWPDEEMSLAQFLSASIINSPSIDAGGQSCSRI